MGSKNTGNHCFELLRLVSNPYKFLGAGIQTYCIFWAGSFGPAGKTLKITALLVLPLRSTAILSICNSCVHVYIYIIYMRVCVRECVNTQFLIAMAMSIVLGRHHSLHSCGLQVK